MCACGADPSSTVVTKRRSALSAARAPEEAFGTAAKREMPSYDELEDGPEAVDVVNRKMPFAKLDFSKVVTWDVSALDGAFALARDTRLLHNTTDPSFGRRPTFLYPDDGCYARADVMAHELEDLGRPSKVFVFGNLHVDTDNSPAGFVSWWYHVAPLVVVDGKPQVIDPSLEPHNAIALEDWIKLQSKLEDALVSVCSPYAFDPGDQCDRLRNDADLQEGANTLQSRFLQYEWDRQVELHRDPKAVLGDSPPWLSPPTPPPPPPPTP
jgi:hypothetical protein